MTTPRIKANTLIMACLLISWKKNPFVTLTFDFPAC